MQDTCELARKVCISWAHVITHVHQYIIWVDILGHRSCWDWCWAGAGVHILDVVGSWCVCGVLGPRYIPHAIPDSHVVELSVKQVKNKEKILKRCFNMMWKTYMFNIKHVQFHLHSPKSHVTLPQQIQEVLSLYKQHSVIILTGLGGVRQWLEKVFLILVCPTDSLSHFCPKTVYVPSSKARWLLQLNGSDYGMWFRAKTNNWGVSEQISEWTNKSREKARLCYVDYTESLCVKRL